MNGLESAFSLFRQLSQIVSRVLTNRETGSHVSSMKGTGVEFGPPRPYQPGDDFRFIDPIMSMKTGEYFIRTRYRNAAAAVMIVVDNGSTMDLGSAARKSDYAWAAAGALGSVYADYDNLFHALIPNGGVSDYVEPAIGEMHLQYILRQIWAGSRNNSQPDSFKNALSRAVALQGAQGDGVIIAVSDLLEDGWQEPVTVLALENDVIVVQTVDPIERKANRYKGVVSRLRTGEQTSVYPSRKKLIERNELAEERHQRIKNDMPAGVDHLVLQTDEPWDLQVADFVAGRQLMMKGA